MCDFNNKKYRDMLKEKKRIVVKIGSSSLTHPETGFLNLAKIERLVRVLCNLRNSGRDVVLVSSGAIAVGRKTLSMDKKPDELSKYQACAAVGQGYLIATYQKIFAEYNQLVAQILMTKYTMLHDENRMNERNTFEELFKLGVIPIVNENDTITTDEIQFGDNDKLSAIVSSVIEADLLILLSDIDGLYTDDPNLNKNASFIDLVPVIDSNLKKMGKSTNKTDLGTGGMAAKIVAAQIATNSGTDMVITNASDVVNVTRIMSGENIGTLFLAHKNEDFDLVEAIS